MKSKTLTFKKGFRIAFRNPRGQAAEMTIAPGDSEGGPDNAHRGADQWLFVVDGFLYVAGVSELGRALAAWATLRNLRAGNYLRGFEFQENCNHAGIRRARADARILFQLSD